MATINDNNQSYLEIQGIEARGEQTARSDYNANDEYSETHKDALATGDAQGKGTGNYGGHGFSVPDMTKPKEQMNYCGLNTFEGGNNCDYAARETMLARSIYGPDRQYGVNIKIDTKNNKGQYDGSVRTRLPYPCPVL